MRRRWRSQYRNGIESADDAPSNLPVSLDEEEAQWNSPDWHSPDGVAGMEEQGQNTALELLFGHPPFDSFASAGDDLPLASDEADVINPKGVSFVDGGGDSASASGSFAHVGRAAPDTIISEAIRLTEKKPVLFPWEKGRMARVFGSQGRLEPKMPRLHPSSNSFVKVDVEVHAGMQCEATIGVRPTRTDDALYVGAVKQVLGGSYIEERDAKREVAVRGWWDLLRFDMKCSDPGRIALQEKGLADIYKNGIEILDASLGVKSPNTVMKRLYAIKTYNTWAMRKFGKSWLPVDERMVWEYVKCLKLEKAPATRASSLLEAIRFCFFVFRVDGCEETLASLRVRGLAAQLYACKRPWKPADPLAVSDVQFLHRAMLDDRRCLVDRVFIGHLLHMVYSRARFSDLLAAVNCVLDKEQMFLELEAAVHKGSRTAVTKAMLLPVVAPANGISNGCWAKDYLALREKAGLQLPGEEPLPMLPAPEKGGTGWQKRFLTSQEMNSFMKKLFADGGVPIEGRRISTHSCKATCISWCAKHDVSPEHRAVLARHSTATQGPTALYSRDLITAALRSLIAVIEAIKSQTFFPDRSRSGMITPVPAPCAPGWTTPMPSTPLPPGQPAQAKAEVALANADSVSIAPSPESPLPETPKSWQKLEWPGHDLDDEFQAAPEAPDLLKDWGESSSDSSYASDSDSDVLVQVADDEGAENASQARSEMAVKWYINGKTLVNHERRNATLFRCGRVISDSFFPVHRLTGLRCSKCFANTL